MSKLAAMMKSRSNVCNYVIIVTGCAILFYLLINITDKLFSAFILFLTTSVCMLLLYIYTIGNKAKKMLFTLTIVAISTTLLEFTALYYYKVFIMNASGLPRYTHNRTTYWVNDENIGYRPLHNRLIRARKNVDRNTIYDVEYTLDNNGWRTTRSNKYGDCSFLFFGGSGVFGEGLHDTQTLPSQFSRKLNYNQTVLNLAFHGYGPHHMLRILESGIIDQFIKGKISTIFYKLSSEDLFNIAGYVEPYDMGPKYIIKDGNIQYVGKLGSFGGIFNSWTDFKTGLVSLRNNSKLFSIIYGLPEMKKDHYINRNVDLLVGILDKTNHIAIEKYQSRFIVFGETDTLPAAEKILSGLTGKRILFINVSEFLLRDDHHDHVIPGDVNPNEQTNAEIAAGLTNRFGEC